MRKISFKAKDYYKDVWVIGFNYTMTSKGIITHINNIFVQSNTVCEFTGFYDINNVPIYEYDIIQDRKGNTFWIQFTRGSFFVIPCRKITRKVVGRKWFFEMNASECEIVGNVFDNPKLVEESEKIFIDK